MEKISFGSMPPFIGGILATLISEALIAAIIWAFVPPRLDWSAGRQKPDGLEEKLANKIVARWVARNADPTTNPLALTTANLMMALKEYEEHCVACHGVDGSGRDRFEADFYPPVPNIARGAQKLSDSELYFIITNGIRNTAMPAFGRNHSPDDIWRTILWVRRLAKLTRGERLAIEREMEIEREQHRTTKRGVSAGEEARDP